MPFESIAKSLFVRGQLPLDEKTYFPTIEQMKDLGLSNTKAFDYYEFMGCICAENGIKYFWQEVSENFNGGVLDENFLYPEDTISNNIDYSLRYFNFVPQDTSPFAENIAKPYVIYKDIAGGNEADYLEINDVVTGHFNSTLFWTARYKGGPVNDINSWAKITGTNPKPFN